MSALPQAAPWLYKAYQAGRGRYGVEHEYVRKALSACEPLVLEALSVYAIQHLWQGSLPVYALMTTPATNGGWGHLMPVWFRPHERPMPIHVLENWALFATLYANSFGPTEEARALIDQAFSAEHLLRATLSTNLLLPFLPSTQGRGTFLRQGMLPFLLGIIWLPADVCAAWLRLHELGAARFLATRGDLLEGNVAAKLAELEFTIFAALEEATVADDQAVARLLSEEGELLRHYTDLFGAICLGVTALARHYRHSGLEQWRSWAPQEIGVAYRLDDYALAALRAMRPNTGASSTARPA